ERCHRINYIAYGRMIASGTVNEVVRNSGLFTFVLEGRGLEKAARELGKLPGVEQVAPFGASLHVVGTDLKLLEKSVKNYARDAGLTLAKGETSLEDVFIKLMNDSTDSSLEKAG
ncbi:MAG TPA: ABC transporter ATP-binding protein, partial [Rhizobiaceae bacterium]|nr:ABC transporter ATP-binding protein [Rhizobiaceae bacterium]